MKVLHIIPDLSIGGAEKLITSWLCTSHLYRTDFRLCVLGSRKKNILCEELSSNGIHVYYLNKRTGFDVFVIIKIFRVIRQFKPDIVHTHLYGFYYTIFPIIINRTPIRIHTLHDFAMYDCRKIETVLRKIFFKRLHFIIVGISKSVADSANNVYGLTAKLIYNGIPFEKFINSIIRHNNPVKILICVANFKSMKNHRLLINAFEKAKSIKDNLKLWLIGEGPLLQEIKNLVQWKNLQEDVIFWGTRNDIKDLLSSSDIFISTSRYEGFGLAIIEAMAAQKPVIVPQVGGIPEVVENGKTGILISQLDESNFANAMIELSTNSSLMKKMGKNGVDVVKKKFDIKRMITEYEFLYKKSYEFYIKNRTRNRFWRLLKIFNN